MKKLIIIGSVLAVLVIAGLLFIHSNPAPKLPSDHPRIADGVAMQDVTFFSAALQRQMPYRVFLPDKLVPSQKLPVVYLLHGANGSFRDWSNCSNVSHYAAQGLILVMPEGAFSYYQNAALKPEDKYEDYLSHDLIAEVEARFPAATGRENRAIMGISMGGYASVKLAMTRPDLFAFVGALSPAIEAPERRFNVFQVGPWWRLRTIFGPWSSRTRQNADLFVLVKSANPARTPHLYLTAGEEEPLLKPNRRFAALLKDGGFTYEFHAKPGGHDWGEWDAQIPGCFESLLRHLKQAV
jgi:S-formylglutathione hydrolase